MTIKQLFLLCKNKENKMPVIMCKESIRISGMWPTYRSCSRKAIKDGYCKQHHPDSVKKRQEARMKRYEETKKMTADYQLVVALETIKDLKAKWIKEGLKNMDLSGKLAERNNPGWHCEKCDSKNKRVLDDKWNCWNCGEAIKE
jgi:hypothetical protein